MATIPNDPLFANQWHLQNNTPGLLDLNVIDVWDDYRGNGIDVFVIDDGFDYNHADLAANYDQTRDFDFFGNDPDPFGISTDAHGTAVMGIIGAVGSNGVGVTGVAYESNIVGYRVGFSAAAFLPNVRDAITSAANNGADVVNMSIGLIQNNSNAFGVGISPSLLSAVDNAINHAVTNGRGGLGTVLVQAAGNSRGVFFDVNSDPWGNNTQQVSVAAVDQNGFVSSYSTYGAAILVSGFGTPGQVVTTDRTGSAGYNSTDYTNTFNGTSAAAPMVSGVVTLMLDANEGLGWRDVQNILAYSARHVGSAVDGTTIAGSERTPWDWNAADNWNGGGLHYSNDYGYGLVDAHAAVRMAESWLLMDSAQTSANQVATFQDGFNGSITIPDGNATGLTFFVTETDSIEVERVTVELDFSTTFLGDMEIFLTSPDGVEHVLIRDQAGTTNYNGRYVFESQAFRGETSDGVWKVRIVDDVGLDALTVRDILLRTYGHTTTNNDKYIFTNEYSNHAGVAGHATTINDVNGGNDWINAAAVRSNSVIHLAGGPSTIDGVGVTISTLIENAIGGDGNDTLTGNGSVNHLYGFRGHDALFGRGGNDVLSGGRGANFIDGGANFDTVIAEGLNGAGFDILRYGGAVYSVGRFDGSISGILNAEAFQTVGQTIGLGQVDVFDALRYNASYDDLALAFRTSSDHGLNHYVYHGFVEGRELSFAPLQYIANYSDLQSAFGGNTGAATNHFLTNGVDEHRLADDPFDYIASFTDLITAFRGQSFDGLKAAGLSHYGSNGFAEDRRSSIDFDPFQYLQNYNDLAIAFGGNDNLSAIHFINHGFAEKRLWEDPLDYIASFADLITAFGSGSHASIVANGLAHFQNNGFAEGRRNDIDFDVDAYLSNYDDLQVAFANGSGGYLEDAATLHFIQHGYNEGRSDDALTT